MALPQHLRASAGAGLHQPWVFFEILVKVESALWVHALHSPGSKPLARSVAGPIYRPNVLIINGSYLVIKADLAGLGLGSPR